MPVDTAAVLVAAGQGRRLGGTNKALLPLGGESLLAHALRALRAAPSIAEIVVVLGDADHAAFEARWGVRAEALGAHRVVPGGAERWLSSRAGCSASDPGLDFLLVHDCARPLVEAADIEAVLAAARASGAALLAEPRADLLKQADADGRVAATLPREGLWRASTPQAARRAVLLQAFERWPADQPPPTDESAVLEAAGVHPLLVAASRPNPKITRAADLPLAEALLAARALEHHA